MNCMPSTKQEPSACKTLLAVKHYWNKFVLDNPVQKMIDRNGSGTTQFFFAEISAITDSAMATTSS